MSKDRHFNAYTILFSISAILHKKDPRSGHKNKNKIRNRLCIRLRNISRRWLCINPLLSQTTKLLPKGIRIRQYYTAIDHLQYRWRDLYKQNNTLANAKSQSNSSPSLRDDFNWLHECFVGGSGSAQVTCRGQSSE